MSEYTFCKGLSFILLDGANPLENRWMAVTNKHLDRVGREIGEILHAQALEGRDHGFGSPIGHHGKGICFVFVFSGKHVAENGKCCFYGRIEKPEENQAGINGGLLHSECSEQSFVVDEEGKDKEHQSRSEE